MSYGKTYDITSYIEAYDLKMKLMDDYEKLLHGYWKNKSGNILKFDNAKYIKSIYSGLLIGEFFESIEKAKNNDGNDVFGTYNVEKYQPKNGIEQITFLMSWSIQNTNLMDNTKLPSCKSWNAQVRLNDKEPIIHGVSLTRKYSDGNHDFETIIKWEKFVKTKKP